jgi:hypothetical protein
MHIVILQEIVTSCTRTTQSRLVASFIDKRAQDKDLHLWGTPVRTRRMQNTITTKSDSEDLSKEREK